MTKRILIFIDSKWRDLPGCALLKRTLEANLDDIRVVACSFNHWSNEKEMLAFIGSFSPHIVFLNHVQGKRNKAIANYVKRHGGSVVVLFNEGILEFDNKAPIFLGQTENSDVDLFCTWNDEVADIMDDDRVVVTGSPRFDFYAKDAPVDSRGLVCEKLGIDPLAPLVVFGDSWPSAKFHYSHQAFHESNWKDLGNTAAKPWENAKEFAKVQYDLQEKFKLMILNFRAETDRQIAVKTHPMSDYFRWMNWGRENSIRVIHGAYIFDILNAADVYVTKAGSITVAEAWLANKPAVKLATDYFDGSSGEQFACDDLNAGFGDAGVWIEEALIGVGGDYDAYLSKWGLVPQKAADSIAGEVEKLLLDTSPPNPQLGKFFGTIMQHDLANQRPSVDGWGNYSKVTIQDDVRAWATRL